MIPRTAFAWIEAQWSREFERDGIRHAAAEVMRFFEFSLINAAIWAGYFLRGSWVLLAFGGISLLATTLYFATYVSYFGVLGVERRWLSRVVNVAVYVAGHVTALGVQILILLLVYEVSQSAVR